MQSPLEIRFHPLDLREHGTNPGGLSLYRIVWADSRLTRMRYEGHTHELRRYEEQPLAGGKWILEKWLPADKYLGMSREEYYAFLAQMPGAPTEAYPEDGEYELVHIYPSHVDAEKTHALIAHLEWRLRNVSLQDRKKEVVAEHEQRKIAVQEAKTALFDEIAGRDTPEEKVITYVH